MCILFTVPSGDSHSSNPPLSLLSLSFSLFMFSTLPLSLSPVVVCAAPSVLQWEAHWETSWWLCRCEYDLNDLAANAWPFCFSVTGAIVSAKQWKNKSGYCWWVTLYYQWEQTMFKSRGKRENMLGKYGVYYQKLHHNCLICIIIRQFNNLSNPCSIFSAYNAIAGALEKLMDSQTSEEGFGTIT